MRNTLFVGIILLVAAAILIPNAEPGRKKKKLQARDDKYVVPEDQAVTFNVLANDTLPKKGNARITHINSQPVTVGDVITLPSGAKLTIKSDGQVTASN